MDSKCQILLVRPKSRNVVLLVVDSLSARHLGYHGYERNIAPFLSELAARSRTYLNAYVPSCHTRESMGAILTGSRPSNALGRFYRVRGDTVACDLRAQGYRTAAFTTGPFLTEAYNYDRGFDRFESASEHGESLIRSGLAHVAGRIKNSPFLSGYDLNDRLIGYVEQATEPYFVWGHYMDVHAPYNPHGNETVAEATARRGTQLRFRRAMYLPGIVSERDRRSLVDQYDNGIAELDAIIEDLFDRLREVGQLDRTVLLITADHGEAFGRNAVYGHRRFLTEELLHVPLVIVGADSPEDIRTTVSTVGLRDAIVGAVQGTDTFSLDGATCPIAASCIRRARRKTRHITSRLAGVSPPDGLR